MVPPLTSEKSKCNVIEKLPGSLTRIAPWLNDNVCAARVTVLLSEAIWFPGIVGVGPDSGCVLAGSSKNDTFRLAAHRGGEGAARRYGSDRGPLSGRQKVSQPYNADEERFEIVSMTHP